jgi:DNA-binding MarR family transcriptional regulator
MDRRADESSGDRLGDLLHRSVRAMRHEWAVPLSSWDISPHQSRALRVIGDGSRGVPRLSEIAERLHIAPRSATEVVDGLEALGLVERVPDATDRRATGVRATVKGQQLQAAIRAAREEVDEEFFGRLTAVEQADLAHLLRKLIEAKPLDD